jgi:prepilin-type N-terminal cleavage/methylation domain-containing protein
MLTHRLDSRTVSARGGFTLVELLVVIGIIAILAGVALGPITNGLKKAKESAAMQSAHAIGIALYSFANDNSQTYPDGGSPGVPAGNTAGATAFADAQALLAGGYVTDPSIFYISGSAASKYTGTASSAVTAMSQANISWDFAGNGGAGLSATNYQYMPLVWTSIAKGTEPTLSSASTSNTAVTCVPGSSDAFGTAGMAVFYINNSALFLTSSISGGVPSVTIIAASNNLGGSPSTASVLLGGG